MFGTSPSVWARRFHSWLHNLLLRIGYRPFRLLECYQPIDQPGVEAYKRNMFALLGKPGFEELSKELNARL